MSTIVPSHVRRMPLLRGLFFSTPTFILSCALLAPALRADADTPAAESASADRITAAEVQAEIKALESSEGLSAEARAKAQDACKQALEELRIADDWLAKAKGYRTARQNAPKELEDVRAQLGKPPADPDVQAPPEATLDELEEQLEEVEEARTKAETELESLEARSRRRIDRVDEVRVLDAAAKVRLDEVDEQLDALPTALDPSGRAGRLLLLAKRAKILAERAAYDEELPSYEATRELMRARLDLTTRQLNLAEKEEKLWKELVAARSQEDAESKAREAHWAVVTARPEVLPLAKENERLAELQNADDGPAQLAEDVEEEVASLEAVRTRLQTQFEHVRKVAELTDAIGLLLQRQQEELPDVRYHRGRIRARRAEVANVKLQLIDLESKRSELADIEPQVEQVVDAVRPPLQGAEREDLEETVRKLLDTRRDYLDDLIADYNKYFNGLVLELDKTEQELVRETELYAAFINERILWIRSSPAIGVGDLSGAATATLWMASPTNWSAVVEVAWQDVCAHPGLYVLAIVVVAAMILARGRVRRRIHEIGRKVASHKARGIRPTVDVLGLTLLLASLWPAVLGFIAWRLAVSWDQSEMVKATAFACEVSALVVLMSELFRHACRKNGLADAHFGWPAHRLARLRRNLLLLLLTSLPPTALVAFLYQQDNAAHSASLGRLAFVAAALLLSTFAWRALRPLGGAHEAEDHDPSRPSWQRNGRWLGYRLGVTVPLALAAIATLGYYYTALQLAWRLQATLWLLLGLVITMSFLLRWLQVTRRELALAQAVSRPGNTADAPCDLSALDAQTRRLLGSVFVLTLTVGAWAIWVDVLPAVKFLDQWKLWSYADAAAVVASPDGKTATVATDVVGWVTVGDAVLAIVILFMTAVASRNLPGLLEIVWLQRLPLDAGGRYAIATVSRYVILLVGIVPALRVLGIGWANVQWLAAAMTVGLGFGLQEIFANFISGLIILFERPMRVGDTVTVGGLTGTVSRIRSRATTITDGDNRELIVPNKEFITGQLVNWTLSDRVLRLVVKVGIAFGSDTVLATRLLLETARAHPLVLKQPAPGAVFTGFGNGALDFELCVFAAGPEHLSKMRHELNTAVNAAFEHAGIEIALPAGDGGARRRARGLSLVDPDARTSEVRHEQKQSA